MPQSARDPRNRFAKFDRPVVSAILLMIFLSSSGAYYSIVGSVDRSSKELNSEEKAVIDHLTQGLATEGMSSLKADYLRRSNIFELNVWHQSSGRVIDESYSFAGSGRFVVGKQGVVDHHQFDVKFSRPESPILGRTRTIELLSELIAKVSFLILIGILIFTKRNGF